MKVLSYNLKKNSASSELDLLYSTHRPEALCLQEVNVAALPKEIGNLSLIIGTEANRLGLALYMDQNKNTITEAKAFSLKKSFYDRVAAPAHERLLGVSAINKESGRALAIGSFHASPLTASNIVRRHQIKSGMESLDGLAKDSPILMIGDFNYPLFTSSLGKLLNTHGYNLTLSDNKTYQHFKMVSGHFDFVTSRKFNIESLKTLKQGLSDHLPILASTSLA